MLTGFNEMGTSWEVRKVGCQRMRWKYDIVKFSKKKFMKIAKDWEMWAHLGEAVASSCVQFTQKIIENKLDWYCYFVRN